MYKRVFLFCYSFVDVLSIGWINWNKISKKRKGRPNRLFFLISNLLKRGRRATSVNISFQLPVRQVECSQMVMATNFHSIRISQKQVKMVHFLVWLTSDVIFVYIAFQDHYSNEWHQCLDLFLVRSILVRNMKTRMIKNVNVHERVWREYFEFVIERSQNGVDVDFSNGSIRNCQNRRIRLNIAVLNRIQFVRRINRWFLSYSCGRYEEFEHEKIRNIERNKPHKSRPFEKNRSKYWNRHVNYPYNVD